jgi:hypothetical protein
MTPAYFAQVHPTYIENWSNGLYSLSIPQIDIPLSLQDTIDFGTNLTVFGASFGTPPQSISRIKDWIEVALKHFPNGAFVRLGSRSGKDSTYAQHYGLKVTHPYAAIKILTEASERVAFDLRLALREQYNPHIFVRQWLEIPTWAEFRCFMKNRKLVGISQYDCKNLGHCPEIAANAKQIKSAIEAFFKEFKVVSHLDDVVFDVFIIAREQASQLSFDVKLLELNPFFEKTDACLFDWHNSSDFDGSFRFL